MGPNVDAPRFGVAVLGAPFEAAAAVAEGAAAVVVAAAVVAVVAGAVVVVAAVVVTGLAPNSPPVGAVVPGAAAVVDVLFAVVAAGFPRLKSEGAAAGVDEGVVDDVPPKLNILFCGVASDVAVVVGCDADVVAAGAPNREAGALLPALAAGSLKELDGAWVVVVGDAAVVPKRDLVPPSDVAEGLAAPKRVLPPVVEGAAPNSGLPVVAGACPNRPPAAG